MPPIVALTLCAVLIIMLLYIERQRNPLASFALWVPTSWILISGSRPVVRWFIPPDPSSLDVSSVAGNNINSLVLGVLMFFALLVLSRRKVEWSQVMKDNFWLIILFLYIGLSLLWSDYPYVSLKRYYRAIGDILMALVLLSEQKPLRALESVFRRCGYVLIPLSVVLINYYPYLGRSYHRWTGQVMWTGVATHKNTLGQLSMLAGVLLIWALLREWREGDLFKNRSQTFADILVLAISLYLLLAPGSAHSATSIGIFIISVVLIIQLNLMRNLARTIAAHLKVFTVGLLLISWVFINSLVSMVSTLLGRDETLTGRTDIWQTLVDAASRKPIFGFGYGGFWGFEREAELTVEVSQGHNGYLDIFIDLGVVGVILFAVFLLSFCTKVRREIGHTFEWGIYGICILMMSLLYNYSESSFLQQGSYLWTTLVYLMVVFSTSSLHVKGAYYSSKPSHRVNQYWGISSI